MKCQIFSIKDYFVKQYEFSNLENKIHKYRVLLSDRLKFLIHHFLSDRLALYYSYYYHTMKGPHIWSFINSIQFSFSFCPTADEPLADSLHGVAYDSGCCTGSHFFAISVSQIVSCCLLRIFHLLIEIYVLLSHYVYSAMRSANLFIVKSPPHFPSTYRNMCSTQSLSLLR